MKKVAVVVMAGLMLGAAGAATPKRAAAGAPVMVKPHEPSPIVAPEAPFDQSGMTLGPAFKGNSCSQIASALKAARVTKDEYETTSAFNDRMSALAAAELTGSVKMPDRLAFVRGSDLPISTRYNADGGLLHISIPTVRRQSLKQAKTSYYQAEVLDSKLVRERDYEASNAYGKSVIVHSNSYDVCAISFLNRPGGSVSFTQEIKLPMPVNMAKSLKGDIDVVYVGRLTDPWLDTFAELRQPTIDSPREESLVGPVLYMTLDSILVTQRTKGAILARLDKDGQILERYDDAPPCAELTTLPDGKLGCK